MIKLSELMSYSDDLLEIERFRDYAPNGLQVEGRQDVERIVSGVTASMALIERAIEANADLLLVHHGYFWKGENPAITGMKARRIHALLKHGISLAGYHLPLDAHPELGNNAQLARLLGLNQKDRLGNREGVGSVGKLDRPQSPLEFSQTIQTALQRKPLWIDGGPDTIKTVAWCTGAAQGYIEQAVEAGVDAYLSGEISEQTVHVAREAGIHYFAAGHHATERYGVQALGEHLAGHFGIHHTFIDVNNPV